MRKWSAWGLLVAIVALNLCSVHVSVRINDWHKNFYNALQAFNSGEVFRQLGIFCIIAAFGYFCQVLSLKINDLRHKKFFLRIYPRKGYCPPFQTIGKPRGADGVRRFAYRLERYFAKFRNSLTQRRHPGMKNVQKSYNLIWTRHFLVR